MNEFELGTTQVPESKEPVRAGDRLDDALVVDDLLVVWEEAYERGRDVPPEELCREQPHLRDRVAEEILKIRRMQGFVSDVSQEVDPAALAEHGYRNLQLHAEGGMGWVYSAEEVRLGRTVAVKLPKQLEPALLEQFQREVMVTSRLEHPGIVPVHDFGQIGDSDSASAVHRPFYTMRFIDHPNLKTAIVAFHVADSRDRNPGERNTTLRKLIGHVVTAAKTIAYAHSRGVLHLDIKPQNIVISKYGETLVVDWGLAESFQRSEEIRRSSGEHTAIPAERSPGTIGGTPAYSAPEQQSANPEQIEQRTDVFLLGGTLYHVLTGRPPFGDSRSADKGLFRKPRPPQEVKAAVPAPLAAICARAMQPDIDQRYGDALEFAEELEQWLADEPVRAYREPLWRRLGRKVRHHRALVTSAAAALAVAVIAGSIGLAVVGQKNYELQTALASESEHRKRANENAKNAAVQRDQAQREKQNASESFRMARATLDKMMNLQEDPRLHVGPLEGLQRELLEIKADFYERFVDIVGEDDVDFQFERAHASVELGRIEHLMGSDENAIPVLKGGRSILTHMLQERPHDGTLLYECALLEDWLAAAYWQTEQLEQADRSYSKRTQLLEQLIQLEPEAREYRYLLSHTLHNHGNLHGVLGREESKAAILLRSLEISRELYIADRDDFATVNLLASIHLSLGDMYRTGNSDRASEHFRQSKELYKAALAGSPEHIHGKFDLGRYLRHEAEWHAQENRLSAAEEAIKQSCAILKAVVAERPQLARYRYEFGKANYAAAELYVRIDGRGTEAIRSYRDAIRAVVPLVESDPADFTGVNVLKEARDRLQWYYFLTRDRNNAASDEQAGIDAQCHTALDTAIAARPSNDSLFCRAQLYAIYGRWQEAIADCRRLIDLDAANHTSWYLAAPLFLAAGDVEGYVEHCKAMLSHFGTTEDPVIADITAKTCLIHPSGYVDPESITRLAELAVAQGADQAYAGYFLMCRGLAAYREGRFEQAIQWLRKSHWDRAPHEPAGILCNLFLSMSYHQSGRQQQASDLLAQTLEHINQLPPKEVAGANIDWHFARIVEREAKALIGVGADIGIK